MNELDMLPNEETIELMNKEYRELNIRNDLMSKPISKPCYSGRCGQDVKDKRLYESIYYLEQDMIMALRRLHTIAPREFREEIAECIKSKKRNSNKILRCYYNVTDSQMSYAPVLSHDNNYCRLLRQIIRQQQRLLLMLTDVRYRCAYIRRVMEKEFSVGYVLSSVAIYCRY